MTLKRIHHIALATCLLAAFPLAHSEPSLAKHKGKRLSVHKMNTRHQAVYRKQKRKKLNKNNQINLANALLKPRPLKEKDLKKEPNGIKAMTSAQKEKFFQARFPDFTY